MGQALIDSVATEGVSSLQGLRADLIHRFITQQGQRYCRGTLRQRCSILRNFLSFLFRRAVLPVDLASAVVAPRVYRHENCPRFLTRSELDAVLAAINRHTPVGKRDYAMFLFWRLMACAGIEVVRLRLDDIHWREQLLQVRGRKAGNSTTYPLSVAVGEALLAYLQIGPALQPASRGVSNDACAVHAVAPRVPCGIGFWTICDWPEFRSLIREPIPSGIPVLSGCLSKGRLSSPSAIFSATGIPIARNAIRKSLWTNCGRWPPAMGRSCYERRRKTPSDRPG